MSVRFSAKKKRWRHEEKKEFCGFYLDCHLHASVTSVEKSKNLEGKTANGEFYAAIVKISSDAKQEPLSLITPNFEVVDENGNRFQPADDAENTASNWEQKIPAGGSFEKKIVFDLPADVKNPRLDISEGYGIDHAIESVLIGDEDSIFHKRNYFNLTQQTPIAAIK